MYSLSFGVKQLQALEIPKGFKGLSFGTGNKQTLEVSNGFKGLSFGFPQGGGVFKIKHYQYVT
jgi:hypothetical protein